MNVLQVFSIDFGGAAIAAKRISAAVEKVCDNNVQTRYVALYGAEKDEYVEEFMPGKAVKAVAIARKLHEVCLEPKTKKYPGPFSIGTFGVAFSFKSFVEWADIIHIHWINRGFFSLKQLEKLSNYGKPIIWTMHDMWVFTGGCHYDGECGKYRGDCENCICICSGKKDLRDIQNYKKLIFQKDNFCFVGCSNWITACARNSTVLRGSKRVQCIPNPINLESFAPLPADEVNVVRQMYGISDKKYVVCFGAMSSGDKRKGGELVHEIVRLLPKDQYQLVVFGNCDDRVKYEKYDTVFLGSVHDPAEMRKIYAMSDVFIAPSVQENLANTVMEALACGTPVVAFDIGGMPDMVVDRVNGRVVRPFSCSEYAQAIAEVVACKEMRENARTIVRKKFAEEIIGGEYYRLYKKMLKEESV